MNHEEGNSQLSLEDWSKRGQKIQTQDHARAAEKNASRKGKYRCEHGETNGRKETPEYKAWRNMTSRCYFSCVSNFKNYGARGIKVCKRWRHSFPNFLADIGRRPSAKHSLDRFPNNDGNYEPGNVRWATREKQDRGKRTAVILEYQGKRMTVAEWSRILSIKADTIYQRVEMGWTAAQALTVKPKFGQKFLCKHRTKN